MHDDLSRIVNILMNNIVTSSEAEGDGGESAKRKYNEGFEEEGARKVSFVLADFRQLELEKRFDPANAVVLSVGGSDGSDLRELLAKTEIKGGILLEYDNDAADAARRQSILENGKRYHVVVGDAAQKLEEAIKKAKSEFSGCNSLISLSRRRRFA